VPPVEFQRESLETPDGDFVDMDWSRVGSSRLLIITHGLEGSSRSPYSYRMTRAANAAGWDVLAWNFRGCGGRPNRYLRSYHSGFTDDLDLIIQHLTKEEGGKKAHYQTISLVGFSVGGNIVLKYLGERESALPSQLTSAVAISTPCDLEDAATTLQRMKRRPYLWYFLYSFRRKLTEKRPLFPEELRPDFFRGIKDFYTLDQRYTAPLFGFRSVEHYWESASSKPYVSRIKIPTLILTAQDDPFFTKACIPYEEAASNSLITLDVPSSGGHVSFQHSGYVRWLEYRVLGFILRDVSLFRDSGLVEPSQKELILPLAMGK
jgi:uncharacterized protein